MKRVNDFIKPILALFIIILAFSYFFSILFLEGKSDPQVIIAIEAMSSCATGYYFGSSSGNAKKDDTISNMANNK